VEMRYASFIVPYLTICLNGVKKTSSSQLLLIVTKLHDI